MAPLDPDGGLTGRRFTWNLDNNRPNVVVVAEVLDLLERVDPDWGTVVEAGGYVGALRRPLRKAGYRLHTGRGSFSRRDSAVIVRKGIPVSGKRVHSLGGIKWERGNGRPGLHDPRHAVSVVVGAKGQRRRVGAIHLPPGPHTWPLRGKAFRVALAKVGRITGRWERATLRGWEWLGDFNKVPTDPIIARLASDRGARTVGNGIDYALVDELSDLRSSQRIKHGTGDHKPRVFYGK